MPGGRPSRYSQKIATQICKGLHEGRSLRDICSAKDMPGTTTVYQWLADKQEFQDQYTRARARGMDAMAEEILDIADNTDDDWEEDPDTGELKLNKEYVQQRRLRIDTRKWLMGKLQPKKYGDRVTTEHTGRLSVTDMTDTALEARIEELAQQLADAN